MKKVADDFFSPTDDIVFVFDQPVNYDQLLSKCEDNKLHFALFAKFKTGVVVEIQNETDFNQVLKMFANDPHVFVSSSKSSALKFRDSLFVYLKKEEKKDGIIFSVCTPLVEGVFVAATLTLFVLITKQFIRL